MISIRPFDQADLAFVRSGWSASYRESRDISFISMIDYAEIMHRQLNRYLLDSPRFHTSVAYSDDVRAGFLCYEQPDFVLYVYVAAPYRGWGIARRLFVAARINPDQRFEYAGRTRASWECRHKIPLAIYNPYRARYEEREGCDEVRTR